jgi:propionyl-CoA carboxylase alpha chain
MNNFLPDIGKLLTYKRPQGLGVRVDDGFEEGMDIPIYYDPMIAKLVTHGKDREEAINRMLRAIEDYQITGVETTLHFCQFVLKHKAFTSGNFDTHFIKHHFSPEMLNSSNEEEAVVAALFGAKLMSTADKHISTTSSSSERTVSKWKTSR